MRRRIPALVAVLAAVLAGCAAPAPGPVSAFADPVAVAAYQETRFAEQLDRMDAAVALYQPYDGERPLNVTTNGYSHIGVDDAILGKEVTVAFAGQPPASAGSFVSSAQGNTLDYYVPAGGEWKYTQLGERYASLAPTPFVAERVPALENVDNYPYTWSFCSQLPLAYLCALRGAITASADAAEAEAVTSEVVEHGDGHTELRSQVTWASLVDYETNPLFPLIVPDGAVVPDDISEQLIPVRLWLDDEGYPVKGEVNVEHESPDGSVFRVQMGFEVTGTSSEASFPVPPSVVDVTYLDAEQAAAFWDGVTRLNAEATS